MNKTNATRSFINNFTRLAIAAAVSQGAAGATAFAQQVAQQTYHIAGGPLDRTLVQIAKTGNIRLSYDASLVQSMQAGPIDGRYSAEDAVRKALSGTGLELIPAASGSYTIARKKNNGVAATNDAAATAGTAAAASAGTSSLAATQVDTSLPLISVQAQRDSGGTGFVAEQSSSYARTDTPLSETPKSVSVVNAAVIQSQNDQSLSDILRNAAGVVTRPGPQGTPSYVIRGFAQSSVSNGVLSDGQTTVGSAPNLTPTIALASVEVLKGPTAILAGDSPAGGVINLVKKTPQAEAFHEIQAGYGSYGTAQLALDSTGSIPKTDDRLRYRFIMSGAYAGQNGMGYDGKKEFYFAPTLQWKDRSTDVTIGYEKTMSRNPIPPFTMGYAKGGYHADYIDHPLGNASNSFGVRADNFFFKLEQKLTDSISFVSREAYTVTHQEVEGWTPATPLTPTNGATFLNSNSTQDYYFWSFQNYVRAKMRFGEVKNTVVAGWDFSTFHYNQADSTLSGKAFTAPNIFAPLPFPASTGGVYKPTFTSSYTQNGFYLQDQFNYKNFHALASIRRDTFLTDTLVPGRKPTAGTDQGAWSPSLGVLYQLTPEVAVYANYNRSFLPASAHSFDGSLLPAQVSEQYEVGAKFNLLDDKVSLTTSAYRIQYSNQNIADRQHPGFSIPTGATTSKGFEVELQGQVLPNLNVVGTYTYNDYKQAANVTIPVNLPKNTATLWATYNFTNEMLQGAGIGAGLFYTGSQKVGSGDLYHLPNQVETDVSLFYKKKNYSLNFSVKNVFNRKLYYSSTSPSFIPMGPERTFLLTGTYDF